MNSFLRWIGGKKLLREAIVKRMPEHNTYVEVFGGGGWVLFHKERSRFEIYNDITTDLTNLYLQVKHHPDALQKELQFMLPSRELFKKVKAGTTFTEIQKATRFLWLIKYSFAAKGESFAASSKHSPVSLGNVTEYLTKVAQRLDKVTIENMSFEKCIAKYDTPETFFYLDPPYYQCQDYRFIGAPFPKTRHIQLAELLRTVNGKWLLSYNAAPYIRELYTQRGIKIEQVERSNNMGGKGNRIYKEFLIRNY